MIKKLTISIKDGGSKNNGDEKGIKGGVEGGISKKKLIKYDELIVFNFTYRYNLLNERVSRSTRLDINIPVRIY